MPYNSRRILVFLISMFLSPLSYARGDDLPYLRALNFLAARYVPEVGLLKEHRGSERCWLYNDNFLAYKILLKHSGYSGVVLSIEDTFRKYNISLDGNGRLEVLFGHPPNSLPRAGEHMFIEYRNEYSIFTERPGKILSDWHEYGDLLLYEVIERFITGESYHTLWNKAKSMFDGLGIKDKVAIETHKYETYKLALFLLTSNLLEDNSGEKKEIIDILFRLQDDDGGFITHYDDKFSRLGFSNVETTCFVILAGERTR